MRKTLIYITLIFLGAICFSCTSECYVSKEAKLGISFLDSITYKPKNINNLTVIGVENDSILYKGNVSAIYLPLRSNDTNTNYRLILPTKTEGKETPDTIFLHIDHTPKPQLISEECGCAMFHELHDAKLVNNTYNFKIQVTNQNVQISDLTVSKDDKETNIKILH